MTERNILSISGGKDSTAMWLHAIERGVAVQPVFADTGHEHPQTYDYLDYLETALGPITYVKADFSAQMATRRANLPALWAKDGVPNERIEQALSLLHPTGIPFLDLCLLKGRFPSTRVRFCTVELKHKPIFDQVIQPILEAGDTVLSWQGVRAEESPGRAKLPEREDDPVPGLTHYRPILRWTVDQVFEIHKRHGIEPNPLYKQGAARVGCSPCIHSRKGEIAEWGKRFPGEVERVRQWEELVRDASKRGAASFFAGDKTPGEHVGRSDWAPGIEAVVDWATNTSRGGRQRILLDEPTEICSSQYGLCE